MKVEFNGTYKNKTVEDEGLWLNTITVKRTDGKEVVLDRDETNYTLENGEADILFRGIYEWDDDAYYPDNVEDVKLYDGAEIIDYEIEDDAPEDYDLEITIGQKVSAW